MTGHFPADMYTDPSEIDPDTMRNLGPLAPLAGICEGRKGLDVHPTADGAEQDGDLERYVLQPIERFTAIRGTRLARETHAPPVRRAAALLPPGR